MRLPSLECRLLQILGYGQLMSAIRLCGFQLYDTRCEASSSLDYMQFDLISNENLAEGSDLSSRWCFGLRNDFSFLSLSAASVWENNTRVLQDHRKFLNAVVSVTGSVCTCVGVCV